MSNLSNVRPQKVMIEVGGKERQLKFTLNAFAEIEEKYGSVDALMEKADEGSMKAVITLLWAGLVHEDENLTEKQVGDMVEIYQLADITKRIGEAMQKSMPAPVDIKGPAGMAGNALTGDSSPNQQEQK